MTEIQGLTRAGLGLIYNPTVMPFNRRLLAQLRERAVLTQKDLAKRARISQMSVHYIEAGKQQPRPATIRALARALGVKPTELMQGEES